MSMRSVTLADLDPSAYRTLIRRSAVPDASIRAAAADIVDRVRLGGDTALRAANGQYGGGPSIGAVRVPSEAIGRAFGAIGPAVRQALKAAAENIQKVHDRQRPVDDRLEVVPGVVVERRWSAVGRVGVYVPGGRAAYPSSVLMGVVPALVAGVPNPRSFMASRMSSSSIFFPAVSIIPKMLDSVWIAGALVFFLGKSF